MRDRGHEGRRSSEPATSPTSTCVRSPPSPTWGRRPSPTSTPGVRERRPRRTASPRGAARRRCSRRDDVDLVVNLTIPAAHAEVALAAVEAGKHVWGEKPLTLDRASARAVLDAAETAGVVVGNAPDTILGPAIQNVPPAAHRRRHRRRQDRADTDAGPRARRVAPPAAVPVRQRGGTALRHRAVLREHARATARPRRLGVGGRPDAARRANRRVGPRRGDGLSRSRCPRTSAW